MIGATLVSAKDSCQDFVFDACTEANEDETIEVVHNVTIESCQFFCNLYQAQWIMFEFGGLFLSVTGPLAVS